MEKAIGADNVVTAAADDGQRRFLLLRPGGQADSDLHVLGSGRSIRRRWPRASKPAMPLPSLHSSLFAPLPEPTIRTGVKAMTSAVLELMKK